MNFLRKLPIPQEIKERYPVPAKAAAVKADRDRQIRAVFTGESDRLLLIVGPCSADDPEAVLAYLARLKPLADAVTDRFLIVPRLFTNKPRTTGNGYKGLLHQPDPEGKPDLLAGIVALRNLHLRSLCDYGFSGADELLYPENHRYLSDLLSYVTVGARSVENQQHRLTASGLNLPVGMKNPTGGDWQPMLNAIGAAQNAHTFLYRGWEVQSTGNPLAHAVLRGYTDRFGRSIPNFDRASLLALQERYAAANLANPAVIVDTNHDNSGRQFEKQEEIAHAVLRSRQEEATLTPFVKGLMIESYLEDGAQAIGEHRFGRSITDPCLGWEKTERLILSLYRFLKKN